MAYKPGDTITVEFVTSDSTGKATNADLLPTGTVNRNGTDDGAVTPTVTNLGDAGRYKAVFTLPTSYASGDSINLSIAATISTVAAKSAKGPWVLDGYRLADSGVAQRNAKETYACGGTVWHVAPATASWVASTAYAVPKQVVNGGNVYALTTSGTSAASGGPTGAGTGITDGTCVWEFLFAYVAPSDSSDGMSWATAFATTAHAALVAVSGDLILLGGVFANGNTSFQPAGGVNVLGFGPSTGISGTCNGTGNPLTKISGTSKWKNFSIISSPGSGNFGLPIAVVSTGGVIEDLWITGTSDGIYFNNVSNCTLRAYRCTLNSTWDTTFIEGPGSGNLVELYDCTLTSTGPPAGFAGPFFSTGIGINNSSGSVVRMFRGSLTATANGTSQTAAHTDSGTIYLYGTTIVTAGAGTLLDLQQASTGSIAVCNTGYDTGKTSGVITVVQTPDTPGVTTLLPEVTTIESQTNLIGTNAGDSPNAVTAQTAVGVIEGSFPPNFSLLGINLSGYVAANLQTIKGQVVTATGAFSFDAQTTANTRTTTALPNVGPGLQGGLAINDDSLFCTVLASPAPTTTVFASASLTSGTNYANSFIVFKTGANQYAPARKIASVSGTTITLGTALPSAPASGDIFELIGYGGV